MPSVDVLPRSITACGWRDSASGSLCSAVTDMSDTSNASITNGRLLLNSAAVSEA